MNMARASGNVPLDPRSTLANATCVRKPLIALSVLWITSDRTLVIALLCAMVDVEPRGGKSFFSIPPLWTNHLCSEQRFFAAGYLEDHKIRRDKKSNCPYWCATSGSILAIG